MIGISNIAWTPEEDEDALALLASLGVQSIEVAPTRQWPALDAVPAETAREFAQAMRARGFVIPGFQAILFGQPELLLFSSEARPRLLNYLTNVAGLCAAMGARAMVFGAPKNRLVPAGMTAAEAEAIAVEFFTQLGAHAAANHVVFGLEANPAAYGCNFCTHADDAARIVRAVNSPGLRWHLDTGELDMNGEDIDRVIAEHGDLIGSAHISESNLDGFAQPWSGHARVAAHLQALKGAFPVSIEMKRQPEGLAAVEHAVKTVRDIYG